MRLFEGKGIKDFLRRRVKNALIEEKISTKELTEFYLVNLLNDYLVAERLYEEYKFHEAGNTLAILLLEALNASANERSAKLKHVGDKALYLSGIFAEYIESKSNLSLNYYHDMGAGAYLTLSSIVDDTDFSELYKELGNNFSPLSRVLAISARNEGDYTATQLLEIYKRWRRNKNKELKRILDKYGFETDKKDVQ